MSNLTDSAQKEYSKLLKSIKDQETIIKKCILIAKASPSDAARRAQDGVVYHQKQVEMHDEIISNRVKAI